MTTPRMMLLGLGLLAGCLGSAADYSGGGNGGSGATNGNGNGNGGANGGGNGGAGGGNALCATGANYVGFDGMPLQADRVVASAGVDRARVKPFSSLAGEYQRVLGATPASLAAAAASFTTPAARWYTEPAGSAVTLYTSLQVAFSACLSDTNTAAQYTAAPDATSASANCTAWAQRFWNRAPQAAELDACVKLALQDTASETNPRRRWAYVCTAALNAAGFLTY